MTEVNEVSEMWRDYHEMKQQKKRSNLEHSTSQLADCGIPFVSHNGGIHLVVTKEARTIDYWPSTGLWWIRGTTHKRRGIQKLIQYMRSEA